MIPDEVRDYFREALIADKRELLDLRDSPFVSDADIDRDLAKNQAALNWLDKPYSHRNGETEPPEVEGFYFVVARYGVNVVRLAKGVLTQCGDANHYQMPIRTEVAYYGPIPEPEARHDDDA